VNLVTQSAMTDTIVPEPSATENAGVAKMPAVQGADLDLLRKGYALVVRQRLEMASRYPGSARRAGRDGSVVLRLHVASDGSIGKTSIESSSTWPDLDQAAVGAANQLSNLPPPPGGSIDVIVPVRFSLRDR
jgi:protein TonB